MGVAVSLRRLPKIENLAREDGDDDLCPSERELKAWEDRLSVRLASAPAGIVIDIFSAIGKNPFTGEGVNAQDVKNALGNGAEDVTVNINSPGGSYFEGATIYSLLAGHKGKVVVNVIGAAASAASLIAMAGDEVNIAQAGSIMIHNAQAGVQGDRHDAEDLSNALGEIDAAIRSIYAARTGLPDAALDKMMTPTIGTWMFGQEAVDKGFADKLLTADKVVEDKSAKAIRSNGTRSARAELDAHLSSRGLSRSRRRELLRDAFPEKITMPAEPANATNIAGLADMIRGAVPEKPIDKPRAIVDPTTPGAGHFAALDKLSGLLESTP